VENEGKRAANLGLVGFQRAPKIDPGEIGMGKIGPGNSQGSLQQFGLPKKALREGEGDGKGGTGGWRN